MIDDQLEPTNILAVDDTPANLLAFESLFQEAEYRLITAGTAQEALKILLDQEVSIILLDVQLKGMNGFDLARLIKQRQKTRDIPIIFLSAFYTDEKDVFQGYSLGAFDYLCKPFNPDVLKAKVRVFVTLHRKNKAIQQTFDQYLQQTGTDRKHLSGSSAVSNEVIHQMISEYRLLAVAYLRAARNGEKIPIRYVRKMAMKLSGLRFRARDVTRTHIAVLKEISKGLFIKEAKELSLDARLLLVEILGYMNDNYLKEILEEV